MGPGPFGQGISVSQESRGMGPEERQRLHGGKPLGFMDSLPMGKGEARERPEWDPLKHRTQSRTQHCQI